MVVQKRLANPDTRWNIPRAEAIGSLPIRIGKTGLAGPAGFVNRGKVNAPFCSGQPVPPKISNIQRSA